MSRRTKVTTTLIVLVALVVAAGVGDAIWSKAKRSADRATRATAVTIPNTIQSDFQPLTGIRIGAPTVVAGAVVNASKAPVDATLQLSGLPAGVTIAQVRPSLDAPVNGAAWSCTNTTCQFVDAAGVPQQVGPDDGAEVMFAFTAPTPIPSDASVTITPAGAKPITVPFALPDGAPPLAETAIVADLAGPTQLQTGTSVAAIARVSNVSAAPAAAGTVTVAVGVPPIEGLSVVPSGAGWTCLASSCTYDSALAPLQEAPPISLQLTAAPTAAEATGALTVTTQATVAGQVVSANDSVTMTVAPPKSSSLSTRLSFDQATVAAPATLNAVASITPLGNDSGTFTNPVRVTLDLPTGLSANWGAVTVQGPWECSATAAGCSSTGPLPAGTPTTLTIPVSVADGTEPGTVHPKLIARIATSVNGGSDSGAAISQPDPSSASFVVVPPPVAELRTTMASTVAPNAKPGDALRFSVGEPRSLALTVSNRGSRSAKAGQTVRVTATPNSTQTIAAAGGGSWKCNAAKNKTVSTKSPLVCTTKLTQDLVSDAALQLPVTLAPSPAGSASWSVNSSVGTTALAASAATYEVLVLDDGPQFAASIVGTTPLYNGGSGLVAVTVQNVGRAPASGGVAVVQIPAAAEVVNVAAPGWNCLNAAVTRANGNITCSTAAVIAPGTNAPEITLELATQKPTTEVELSAWTAAVGQFNAKQSAVTERATIPVAGSLVVDAGQDLTVVTPQRGPNGVEQPAVVTLHGTADVASAQQLRWTQLCTTQNQPQCNGTVSQPVTWVGLAAGQSPTTATASFTAPSNVTAPTDLYFELSGRVGSKAVVDQVTVRLVPATLASGAVAAGTTGGGSGASGNGSGAAPVPQTTLAPNASFPAPTAAIAGSGAIIEVATRAPAQLIGSGTGVGALQYEWKQTSGPAAAITGGSSSQSTLVFESPTLAPSQQSEQLAFQLTVTDSRNERATASVTVNVVWGDNGLQVQLANGQPNVVSSIDAPVTVTSQVTSRGAPYQYSWSASNLSIPSGTPTNQPTLAFTAGAQPANGSVSLTVTDSFGRVTTVAEPVIISALPQGELPQVFCNALAGFTNNVAALLEGSGVAVTIPSATVSGAGPVFACTNTETATFTDATVALPGGVTVTKASGQLTVAGVSLAAGTVVGPANWNAGALALGNGGLLVPFVSTSAVGVPYGAVSAAGLPLVQPAGWSGSTTVTFVATPSPRAVLSATGTNGSSGATLSLVGSAIDGATTLTMNARGLVVIGSVDVPVVGTVSTASAASGVESNVTGSLPAPTALVANVSISRAQVTWTPAATTGTVALTVGAGAVPLTIVGNAEIAGAATQLTFVSGASNWTPSAGSPPVVLAGSGSITGQQLALTLASQPSAAWPAAHDLVINAMQATLTANCALSGSAPCSPQLAAKATATSETFAGGVALSGTLDVATQVVQLTGTVGSLTVAPATLSDVELAVSLSPTGLPLVSAVGDTAVRGTDYTGTAAFLPAQTLVSIPIGEQSIVAGWSIPAVTALATDVTTIYTPPSGALANEVFAVIPAGQLTAVGATQLPAPLASGVIPNSEQTVLASYEITNAPPSQYTLNTVLSSPWFVAGSSTSAVAVTMTTVAFQVNVAGGSATVGVTGDGALQTAAWMGGAASTLPLTFSGQLTNGTGGGALSGRFSTPDAAPWTNAFGVAGLNVGDVAISTNLAPTKSTVTLTGATTLPAAFATPLGIPTTATPTMTADITATNDCASIDLATGNATGVNIGGAGFLASSSATLYVAPLGCTDATGASYPVGLSLSLGGGVLGTVLLPVNPATFAITDSENVGALQIGGLALTDVVVQVETGSATPSIQVSGNTTLDNTPISVSGTVQPPTTPGSVGSLTLSSANQPTFGIGGTAFTNVTINANSLSVPSPGSSQVTVNGTTSLLGQSVDVSLQGSIQSGTIDQLTDTLGSAPYALASGDSLTAAFEFTYNLSATPSLTVQATGATLTTPTQSYTNVTAQVASTNSLNITACAPYMTEVGGCATVSGAYSYSGPNAGQYSYGTQSAVVATLSGYSASTMLKFARPNAGAPETTNQTSTLTLGLFDSNQALVVSGPIGGTLTGALSNVAIRGLSGDAQVNVVLDTTTQTGTTWYDVNITMNASGGCNLWSNQPTLNGVAYRSVATTYYTLTGPVSFGIDGFTIGSAVPGQSNQPLVLSNEVAVTQQAQQDQQPANGLTLQLSMQTGPFTAVGTAGFDLANCSYSVGAFVQLNFSAGAMSEALGNAFKQNTAGLSVSQGNLFSNGVAPTSLVLARAYLQETAIAAYLNNYASNLQSQANANGTLANIAQQQANAAQQQYQQAQAQQEQAAASYRNALNDLATAQASQEETYQNALPFAEAELQDAQNAVDNAQAQVAATQATLETTTSQATTLQTSAQNAAGESDAANTRAFNAQQDYENFQADLKQAETTPTFELTLDYTHCLTCVQQNVGSVDGEVQFISGVLVGLSFQLGWANGSLSTVGGSIFGGFNYQYYKKLGPISVYANASIVLTISATDQLGVGWQQFTVSPTATAVLQLWASVWGISYSATLADLTAQLQFAFVPSDTIAGSVNFSFLWFSGTASFGPDSL